MDDGAVLGRIEELVAEERKLLSSGEGKGPDPDRDERLQEVKVALDRCWDLLRQRRAEEEFGRDPDQASLRDADTVEGYEQ
ncbi:MAG: DUF2630 family protein [Actinomycetota bacterium]|nr:DUF2630 family protein [Actinomycetota bacterium]